MSVIFQRLYADAVDIHLDEAVRLILILLRDARLAIGISYRIAKFSARASGVLMTSESMRAAANRVATAEVK